MLEQLDSRRRRVVRVLVEWLVPYFRQVDVPCSGRSKDIKAADVLANPPFKDSDCYRSDEEVRWMYDATQGAARTSPGGSDPSTTCGRAASMVKYERRIGRSCSSWRQKLRNACEQR